LDRREKKLDSIFVQFSDARMNLFTVIQFLAFVDKVVQLVDVSGRAKS